MPKLINENTSVDLILTDIPYGNINGLNLDGWTNKDNDWDNIINPDLMFKYCEQLLRVNGTLILFSQEPLTSSLRQHKHFNLPFTYPLFWRKDHFANSLSCKKAPVSLIEDLSVFRKTHDTYNKHPLRQYAQNLLKYMGVTSKDIERKLGHRRAEHFFYPYGSSQFKICTKDTYEELIKEYDINNYPYFKTYDELVRINDKFSKPIFNLCGKKYKSNVLEYKKSYNRYHPTEKPVPLLEDLIKTYTNPGDTVLDFTMGSGSTGVASVKTNREFIGIELDEQYYAIAEERIKEINNNNKIFLEKNKEILDYGF